jgi:hypothetical protein
MPSSPHPILVSGAHRTGTTWVGKMLAAGSETAYISEPLNVLHRPGVLRVPVKHWYTYICADNEAAFLPALGETLSLRYGLLREMTSLRSTKDAGRMLRDAGIFYSGKLRGARPLLKDPFAVFSTEWFARRLDCEAVITVRHPAAFASSLKRLGWSFDFGDLLAQPLLMRDWLEPLRGQMEAMLRTPDDVIGQAALLWRAVYSAVLQMRMDVPQIKLVRHEDLSLDPVGGFRGLYGELGLPFTAQVEQTILSSSSSENPGELSKRKVHTVRLDSRANLHNWKHRLEKDEITRVRVLTEDVASAYYPEIQWE